MDKESHLVEIESEKEQQFLSTVLTKRYTIDDGKIIIMII